MRLALTCIIIWLVTNNVPNCQAQQSQPFLSLQKPMKFKNIRYHQGDDIILILKGEKKPRIGYVRDFDEMLLGFNDTLIHLRSIRAVIRGKEERKNSFISIFSRYIWKVGLAYPIIDIINNGLPPTPATYIVPATGIFLALVTRPFIKRTYRLDKNWRLQYLDLGSIKR